MSRKIPNAELDRLSEEQFKQSNKHSIILILDQVRSMQNVGAIFRSADAFLLQHIFLCGITATPPHRDILKTALGATETVSWSYCETTEEAIEQAKKNGFKIAAVEQVEQAKSLETVHWQNGDKLALVFGHEVKGVQQSIVNSADYCIEIPQWGSKHSFNISVSVGIVLWQLIGTTQ